MSEVDMDAYEIDRLRLVAFSSNSPVDRQAYFDAASKWFQDRHVRAMRREEDFSQQLSQARDEALEEAAQIAWDTDAKYMRATYKIDYTKKRYDVYGVMRCENTFSTIQAEDAAKSIRALKSNTPTEEE